MLAVIQTGGKQYLVSPGDEIEIEKIKTKKEGDEVVFKDVLLMEKRNKVELGAPLLKGAQVQGKIVEEGRGEKIDVIKYKSKTRYLVKKGHRQPYMKVKIEELEKKK